jgi:hypothetical protein
MRVTLMIATTTAIIPAAITVPAMATVTIPHAPAKAEHE